MSALARIGAMLLPLVLLASEAWACPACAMRENNGYGNFFIMAGLIFSPFAVCGGVVMIIKRFGPLRDGGAPGDDTSARGF